MEVRVEMTGYRETNRSQETCSSVRASTEKRHRFGGLLFGLLALFVFAFAAGTASAANERENFKEPRFLYVCSGYTGGKQFSLPKGIFFDSRRRELYVADSGNHRVAVFDSAGVPLFSFPVYVEDNSGSLSRPGEPRSVAADSKGRILVADALSKYLHVFDFKGVLLDTVNLSEKLSAKNVRPDVVAVDADDNVYVGTGGEIAGIARFDSELELKSFITCPSDSEGEGGLKAITSLWVDEAGKLYVTDAISTPCVRVLSQEGETLLGFGQHDAGWNNFSFPAGVLTTRGGLMWAVDAIRQVVSCFGPEGEYLGKFGGLGGRPGDLFFPVAIAGDGIDKLFILESSGARYQLFVVPAGGEAGVPESGPRSEPGTYVNREGGENSESKRNP